MTNRRKITTKRAMISDENGDEYYDITPMELALVTLALAVKGNTNYSGSILTAWNKGGLRGPDMQIAKCHRSSIAEGLREFLPSQDFTGKVVFHLNSGELSGKPQITS